MKNKNLKLKGFFVKKNFFTKSEILAFEKNLINFIHKVTIKSHKNISKKAKLILKKANDFYRGDRRCGYFSMHGNAANTKAHGIEIFTSKGETMSDKYATTVMESIMKSFPDEKFRLDTWSDGDIDKEANFYVLRKTAMPAMLLEMWFFDNRKDAEKMNNPLVTGGKYETDEVIKLSNENFEKLLNTKHGFYLQEGAASAGMIVLSSSSSIFLENDSLISSQF